MQWQTQENIYLVPSMGKHVTRRYKEQVNKNWKQNTKKTTVTGVRFKITYFISKTSPNVQRAHGGKADDDEVNRSSRSWESNKSQVREHNVYMTECLLYQVNYILAKKNTGFLLF